MKREGAGEGFTAGFEPLVEHQRLEQRSRETFEKESRIGFARPEPFAQEREVELVEVPRERGTGASRNLLLHKGRRRDVLKIQRTALERQIREGRTGWTKEKELGFRRGESRKGAGVFSPFHRSKVLFEIMADDPGREADKEDNHHDHSELHDRLFAGGLADCDVGGSAA